MDTFDAKLHRSIAELDASLWQSCFGDSDPFLRWDFLHGLETSACTTAESGWQPAHITLEQSGAPVGVLPAYLKTTVTASTFSTGPGRMRGSAWGFVTIPSS